MSRLPKYKLPEKTRWPQIRFVEIGVRFFLRLSTLCLAIFVRRKSMK